jgi:SagB-type dehydrogenase family enzyme
MKTNTSLHGAFPGVHTSQSESVIALFCKDPIVLKEMSVRFRSLGRIIMEFDDLSNGQPAFPASADLIISCATNENILDQHHRARKLALASSAPWLAATWLTQRYFLIHGFLDALSAPCVECVVKCIRDQLSSQKGPESLEPSAGQGRAVALTALLLNHVMISLMPSSAQVRSGVLRSPIRLYDIDEMSSIIPLAGRIPGCDHCWPSTQRYELRVHLGALYEECSRNQVKVRDSEIALRPNMAISSRPVRKETDDEIVLPVPSVLHQQRDQVYLRGLSTLALANLLFLSFGKWGTLMQATQDRVLPSAGNLSSAKCYLILQNCPQVPSGAYIYEEDKHVLSPIGPVSKRLLLELLMVDTIPEGSVALLLVVGQFGRIGTKYGPFGYRLAHFDCGIAISQLHAMFNMFGSRAVELAAWPEESLARCLGLSPSADAIMTVFMLGSNTTTERPDLPSQNAALPGTCAPVADSPKINAWSLVDHLNKQSREQIAEQWKSSGRSAFPTEAQHGCERRRSPYTSMDDMWIQLLTRRSVRSFTDIQVLKDTVTNLMEDIAGRLPGGGHLSICATIRVAAGSDDKWLTYEIDDTGSSLISTLEEHASFGEVFIDPQVALAPLVLWFCGDVRGTALKYRRMLIDIGRSAHEAWRAASRYGLAGYYVAGFRPHLAAQRLGLRLCTRAPLLAFACGISTSN